MKVVHVISELNVGGTEMHLVKLLPYLEPAFQQEVYCLLGRGSAGTLLEGAGVRVVYGDGKSRFSPLPLFRLVSYLAHVKPDAVVTYLVYADILGRLAGKISGVPKIISSQRSSLYKQGWLRFIDKATSMLVDHYVVQTRVAQQMRGNVHVIPNTVSIPSNPALLTTKKTICVANLKAGKGHVVLIEAFSRIAEKYPDWTLQLVGDGPLATQLKQQAKAAGARIEFLGQRSDVATLLQQSSIFVLATEAEGMSNAILEAMAAGLPCVVSDIPVNRELVSHSETGLLINAYDAAGFADAMEKLMADSQRRHRLGAKARAYVERYHAPQKVAAQWKAVLTTV